MSVFVQNLPFVFRLAAGEGRAFLPALSNNSTRNVHGGTVGFGLSLPKGLRLSVAHDLTKRGERKVSLEYQLSPHWQIDTSSSAGGASEAHILWQKKY